MAILNFTEALQGNFTPEASPPELQAKSTTSNAGALDGQFFHIFHPSGYIFTSNNRNRPEVPGHKAHYAPGKQAAEDYVGLIIGVVSGVVILALIGLTVSAVAVDMLL